MGLLKSNPSDFEKAWLTQKRRATIRNIRQIAVTKGATTFLNLPPISASKTSRDVIVIEPKIKKQEDLVERYKKLRFRQKFDKEEVDASFAIEKGDAIQEEYRKMPSSSFVLSNTRYQSKKNLERIGKFNKNGNSKGMARTVRLK
mmetsp:Transcript_15589/g.13628  ORF Transcript_15589/g.13628 Transcript_15589/m.13628 type:complete len:145 (-) Transcript_15589:19-453(-)